MTRRPRCPRCGGLEVIRSKRRNLFERVLSLLNCYPFRCEDCGRRFFGWGRGGS